MYIYIYIYSSTRLLRSRGTCSFIPPGGAPPPPGVAQGTSRLRNVSQVATLDGARPVRQSGDRPKRQRLPRCQHWPGTARGLPQVRGALSSRRSGTRAARRSLRRRFLFALARAQRCESYMRGPL